MYHNCLHDVIVQNYCESENPREQFIASLKNGSLRIQEVKSAKIRHTSE